MRVFKILKIQLKLKKNADQTVIRASSRYVSLGRRSFIVRSLKTLDPKILLRLVSFEAVVFTLLPFELAILAIS